MPAARFAVLYSKLELDIVELDLLQLMAPPSSWAELFVKVQLSIKAEHVVISTAPPLLAELCLKIQLLTIGLQAGGDGVPFG